MSQPVHFLDQINVRVSDAVDRNIDEKYVIFL